MNNLTSFLKKLPCVEYMGTEVNVTLVNLGGLAQRLVLECPLCDTKTTQDLSNRVEGNNNILIIL